MVDQHAAHERLTYERLKAGLAQGEMPRQGLLTPQTLELTPGEAAWATEQAGQWSRLGLELEPFGGNTWAIRAVPPHLAGGDPRPAVRDLLSQMSASRPAGGDPRSSWRPPCAPWPATDRCAKDSASSPPSWKSWWTASAPCPHP